MVSQSDLVKATLRKISKATQKKLKSVISERGAQAGATFISGIIAKKTGLPQVQAAVIGGIIARKAIAEIRSKLKW
ncbi:unnamed protein product [marine sediment metagenome]|uniref:Uncharacterized protein n=1 Tax=marine sediment metagenome TaxID=412755 RepID=X1LVM9_9ZZZZ